MRIFNVFVFGMLLIFSSCTEEKAITSPFDKQASDEVIARGTVSGKVIDSTKSGLAGVSITLVNDSLKSGGYSTNTDEKGKYNVADVIAGTYEMIFSKDSYTSVTKTVTIAIDEDVNVDEVTLKFIDKFGAVSGNLLNSMDGSVIAGEMIKIGGYSTFSNSKGYFLIENIEPGMYSIIMGGNKYQVSTRDSISVSEDITTEVGLVKLDENLELVERTISGILVDSLGSLLDVSKIVAIISGENITEEKEVNLDWLKNSSSYTGVVYIPSEGEYEVIVKVFDINGILTGQKIYSFSTADGDIDIPSFSNFNAKPYIEKAFADTLIRNEDTEMVFNMSDNFSGAISNYKIDFDNDGIWDIEESLSSAPSQYRASHINSYSDLGYVTYKVEVTDNEGNVTTMIDSVYVQIFVWRTYYGGDSCDFANSVIETKDGSYLYAWYTRSTTIVPSLYDYNEEAWLVKMDKDGNKLWDKCYGGSESDRAEGAVETSDGSILVAISAGSLDSIYVNGILNVVTGNGKSDFCLMKLSETGELQWIKKYGGTQNENINGLEKTSDGNYVMAGGTLSSDGDVTENNGASDIWVVKVDEDGKIIWAASHGTTANDGALSVSTSSDGSIFVAGTTEFGELYTGSPDMYVCKLSSTGSKVWEKTIVGSSKDILCSVAASASGGCVVGGYSSSDDSDFEGKQNLNADFYVAEISSNGDILWSDYNGSGGSDQINDVMITSDNYIVTAVTEDYESPTGASNTELFSYKYGGVE